MSQDPSARLRRLEVQIRALRELHVREVGEVADRLAAIARIQADELQLILEELADIVSSAEDVGAADDTGASVDVAATTSPVTADLAKASPKRAKWLAEQERRAHMSRRDLLRGREKT